MFKDTLGVYPDRETYASSDYARCLMFYDWEKSVGLKWLELAAEVFAEFGQTIFEGTGNLGVHHSHGRFSRVQKKLAGFLGAVHGDLNSNFDIRMRSRLSIEDDAFFPCDVEMVLGVEPSGRKEGAIAVRETLVDSCDSLIKRVGEKLFRTTGTVYANSFDFPTLFGPASYQASIGAIPSGMSTRINEKYTERITRWRDNRWGGLLPSQGYLREVYPINFVLDSHLNMPFQNRPLSEYMKRVGSLIVSEYNNKMYLWTVPPERIDRVRQDLESSGIVLSSTQPPLRVTL
jgi:hypothetical protein